MKRINTFLEREIKPLDDEASNEAGDPCLHLTGAAFSIATGLPVKPDGEEVETKGFQISKFDFSIRRGEVLAVCGHVGSGKSTMINGIIGEAAVDSGHVQIAGRVAVVPQSPFILNTTFRENILFGRPFDKDYYDKVIDACCLNPDILQLGPLQDSTEIGERGVTLSGGQKQRISLARAAYARPDLVLLDDPLSALDAGVSRHVFNGLIKSPTALLKGTAVVLVTHASHFLSRVDKILVLVAGENKFLGTWEELSRFNAADPDTQSLVESFRLAPQEKGDVVGGSSSTSTPPSAAPGGVEKHAGKLMSIEEREYGLSSVATWLLWFRRAGGMCFLSFQLLFMAIDRFSYVATEYWLARWTKGATQSVEVFTFVLPEQSEGRSAQYEYLLVYCLLIFASIATTLARSEWAGK